MSAVGVLALLVTLYAGAGAALAFNVWRASDRVARLYGEHPHLLAPGPFRHDTTTEWRAWGLVMFSFGAIVLAWMALAVVGIRPQLDRTFGTALLLVIGVSGVVAAVVLRLRRR